MTPWNYELFEFNKMLLIYFLTIVIVGTWLIKMVVTKKIIFRRSFWDIPLLVFFISQFASTLLSIDRHTSFWGYYSRFNGGLLSIICYLLLYWAFVSNMKRRYALYAIRYMLISAVLVAVYGIAEHFGIDAKYWVQDVRNRVFSTLGQPNWLAAWLVALAPITWGFALISKIKSQKLKIQSKNQKFLIFNMYIYYLLFTIYYLCLLYTKSRSGLLGFSVAYLLFWSLIFIFIIPKKKPSKQPTIVKPFVYHFSIFSLILVCVTLFIGTPWTPNILKLKSQNTKIKTEAQTPVIPSGGTESGEIRKIVWKGAIDIWKHHPVFGPGVETFAYSYYWYRPREHNDVSEWDFLYNKAHNEYLNFAATTGTVGLGSYLLLIGWFIVWSLRKLKIKSEKLKVAIQNSKLKKEKLLTLNSNFALCTLHFALFSGFASILVTNFFGFSVVPVAILFFLFPALSVVLASTPKGANRVPPLRWNRTYTSGIWQWVAVGGILLCVLRLTFYVSQYWYADTRFALGEKLNKANQPTQAFNELQKAIKIRPGEPIYHDGLGLAAADLAVAAFQQEQSTLSAQLIQLAISESDKALKISPYNLNFWKNRTRIFYKLSEIDEKYNQDALTSLLNGAKLAPTDAKIQYNLGVLYAKIGQEETAIKTLEKTIELKPNYDQARYALALFYEQKGEIQKAKEQLEYILEKINPQHEAAREKLKNL